MRENAMTLATEDVDLLIGPPRTLRNLSDSSIHDPEAAKKLGFRGAAVGANVHLDLFAPPLVEVYGQEWFERGALSLYFLNVVVSGEQARAVVERPATPGAQTNILERRADDPGIIVSAGTTSLGDHSRSALRTRDLKTCDDSRLRMLRGVKAGQAFPGRTMVLSAKAQQDEIAAGALSDTLDWYSGPSPWGGPIASLSATALMMIRMLIDGDEVQHKHTVSPHIGDALSMFGAFELAFENGPVFLDRPYTIEGKAVGVGDSPKTELLWWDAVARDETGRAVLTMRHLFRFLKATSPLYPELAAA
jgi:hypothetical protein